MVGEGNFVSKSNLGGSSKHLAVRLVRAVQGLGLPGSSSQRNGTEADEWSGGVCIPEGSVDCIMGGTERSGSFRMELTSGSASPAIPISLSLSVGAFRCWFFMEKRETKGKENESPREKRQACIVIRRVGEENAKEGAPLYYYHELSRISVQTSNVNCDRSFSLCHAF